MTETEIIASRPLPKVSSKTLIWQPVTAKEGRAMRLAPLDWLPSGAHEAVQMMMDDHASAIAFLSARIKELEASVPAPVDPAVIEASGKRWHGEDHRVVSVRWEPYKPEGARQMKAPGRWQECQASGDFHRWQNCDRPSNLTGETK